MSARNNRRPNDSLLRGLTYCGICGRKMHLSRYTRRGHIGIDYHCKQNLGNNADLIHHHSVSISVANLDGAMWEFVLPYVETPTLIRENITAMRGQVDTKDRGTALELHLTQIKEKIINLLAVAEDARGETTRQMYRERLAKLEHDVRETEILLSQLSNTTERNQKLLTALDKFEAWAVSQQQFLRDPDYDITKEDKRVVLLVLGVKATVWPSEGYPQRTQFEISPPDIQRFCDFNFQ